MGVFSRCLNPTIARGVSTPQYPTKVMGVSTPRFIPIILVGVSTPVFRHFCSMEHTKK